MRIGKKELDSIYTEYSSGEINRDKIEVDISDNINTIDTLVLLRVMSGKLDYADFAPVMETALDGHTVSFILDGVTIKSITYNRGSGNALSLMFTDTPYLYDMLQQTVHALLLKKLTPHLEGSN